jgi:hypothetical protein
VGSQGDQQGMGDNQSRINSTAHVGWNAPRTTHHTPETVKSHGFNSSQAKSPCTVLQVSKAGTTPRPATRSKPYGLTWRHTTVHRFASYVIARHNQRACMIHVAHHTTPHHSTAQHTTPHHTTPHHTTPHHSTPQHTTADGTVR